MSVLMNPIFLERNLVNIFPEYQSSLVMMVLVETSTTRYLGCFKNQKN